MKNYVVVITNFNRGEDLYIAEEDFLTGYVPFSLDELFDSYFIVNPEKMNVWNEYVNEEWEKMEYLDENNGNYEIPEVTKNECGQWLCYDIDNCISTIQDCKKTAENYLEKIKRQMELLKPIKF